MIIIVATSANELIADGRAALRVGDAATARSSFEAALALGPNSAALEGLGFADYLAMDFDEAIDLWQQSYAGYRADGNGAGAVRVRACSATCTASLLETGQLDPGGLPVLSTCSTLPWILPKRVGSP